jgi:hypothetical protein
MNGYLGLNGRRPEKTMELSQRKVSGGWRNESALDSELLMKI